jgi:two-component system LytT family response regulator
VTTFHALIVDDEPPSRRVLRQLIQKHADVAVVAEARDSSDALKALSELNPDLVFLDIQLPGASGIDIVRQRGVERMPPVVFVTAYDEFAVQAFELAAIDYLMKPVSQARFDVSMQRVRRARLRDTGGRSMDPALGTLLDIYEAQPGTPSRPPFVKRLRVRVGTRDIVVPAEDVCYIVAHGVYARLHTGKSRHLVREPMHFIERRLDPSTFVRIHRSYIVNADFVRELRTQSNGDRVVVMKSGEALPISRRRRGEAERMLLGDRGRP